MDTRVKKTQRAIRGAFYQLIMKKPIDKITIKEICEIAEINKTTFYSYYGNLYDLLDAFENEAIDFILTHLDENLLLFTGPEQYVQNCYHYLEFYPYIRIALHCTNGPNFSKKLKDAMREVTAPAEVNVALNRSLVLLSSFVANGMLGILDKEEITVRKEDIDLLSTFVKGGIHAVQKEVCPAGAVVSPCIPVIPH